MTITMEAGADTPLAGIRVVEIGEGVAVPAAGRLLAGFGAEVTRIELPRGDETRRAGPFRDGNEDRDASGLHLWLNTGKRSAVFDYFSPAGRDALHRLVSGCDLLMSSLSPGPLSDLGLDYDRLSEGRPSFAMLSVTPYGLDGPNSGFQATDLTSFATGGQMWMTGEPHLPPVKNFGSQAEQQTGLHAFAAALTLIYGALVQGRGDMVDLSIQEAQASILEVNGPNAFNYGTESFRHGNVLRSTWGVYPCKDGHIGIHVLDRNLPQFFHAMGRDDLTETYMNPAKRAEDNDLLEAIIYGWCADHTERELFEAGVEAGAPIAYLPRLDELLSWPGLMEKDFWVTLDHPVAGPLPYPRAAISIEGSEFRLERPPLLGEHTGEVLAAAGLTAQEVAAVTDSKEEA